MMQAGLFESFDLGAAVQPAGAFVARYFHRCADCLSVAALDREYGRAQCAECGGRMEYMGRTSKIADSQLVRDTWRCPCDARCTHAMGPDCDCRCGGKNHGSGMWVPVTESAGAVPLVHVKPGARKFADHYRALVESVRAAIQERYGRAIALKAGGVHLEGPEYRLYCRGAAFNRRLNEVQGYRAHHTRNRKLEQLLREVTL